MTDEQITAPNPAERLRVMIDLLGDGGHGCFKKASLCAILDYIDAQAAEIATLKALVQGWHYLAVGPDEMGDYHTHRALIKASEPYAHPALKALAQETKP